jgi:hypothetical protein
MKRVNKIMLLIITLTGCTTVILSQNLDSMPKLKRDSILIANAKKAVLRCGPEYYREYKEPIIDCFTISPKGENNPTGENAGRKMYSVAFLYDTAIELLEVPFAAKVHFWANTSKPADILFGNGIGVPLDGIEQDSERLNTIPQIPYQEVIFPIYDDFGNSANEEPKNIDILKRKGYEEIDGQWVKTKKTDPPNIDILKREGYEKINGQWIKTKKDVPPQIK